MALEISLRKKYIDQKKSFMEPPNWDKLRNDLPLLNARASFTYCYRKLDSQSVSN